MANSDKNILITPNVSQTAEPTIRFTGFNNTPTTLRVLDDGTLSLEGTAGQLFSISDGLSGTIFSVNDISGIPSIEVLDTGNIRLAQYGGNISIGAASSIGKLGIVQSAQSSILSLTNTNSSWAGDFSVSYSPGGVENSVISLSARSGGGSWVTSSYGDMIFRTGTANSPSEKMRINSSGNLGIGTSSPLYRATVNFDAPTAFGNTAANYIQMWQNSTVNAVGIAVGDDLRAGIIANNSYSLELGTGGAPRLTINGSNSSISAGATDSLPTMYATRPTLGVHTGGDLSANDGFAVYRSGADANGTNFTLAKTRGANTITHGLVASGDSMGRLHWVGSDGTNFIVAASIDAKVDGTPGTNDMPGRLSFQTTADGASVPTERMRIDSAGRIQIPAGGILEAPVSTNAQTGTAYTLVLTDAGRVIEMNNAAANTLTIPLNSSVAFPIGTKIDIIQTGAGATSIAPTSGVTLNSDTNKRVINAQWAAATLIKRATDTWILIGALKT